MRCTASLLAEGLSEEEIIERVHAENLFQHPTTRMLRNLARVCLARLQAMDNPFLLHRLAFAPAALARQISLYAMMKQNLLVRDFMLEVVAEKFRTRDYSFSKADVDLFFQAIAREHDAVAAWTINTREKIRQVLVKVLVENEYLDSARSTSLNLVLLEPELKDGMLARHDGYLLPAFNYFLP